MAEDRMLINFDFGDAAIKPKQTFKGGAWRDRVKAKKTDRWRQSRLSAAQEGDTRTPNYAINSEGQYQSTEQRAKRQKIENNAAEDSPNAPNTRTRVQPNHSKNSSSQPREVISSLFSFNPEAKTVVEKPVEDVEPTKPTNAPLIDGLDTFTSLGISPTLAAHLLTKLGFKAPTAIQTSSISQLLKEDSDAFIQAETGSGKTLAYLLPLIQRIMDLSKQMQNGGNKENGEIAVHRDSGLFALILAPTRELCKQISVVLEGLLRCAHWIVAGTIMGGEKKKSEKARLRKGLNILVATPGRLADHLDNTKVLDVSNVRWLVLDEGDRLMDMGMEEEIQGIVKKLDSRQRLSSRPTIPGLPVTRTTILCSATMKINVQRLGEISLKDAVLIKPDDLNPKTKTDQCIPNNESSLNQESAFSAPAQLKQSYIVVPPKLRLVTLVALLKRTFRKTSPSTEKVIVFFSCSDVVDFHFDVLTRSEITPKTPSRSTSQNTTAPSTFQSDVWISRLHGSLPQHLRTSTLQAFSSSHTPSILLSTDLASRGIDLPTVSLVLSYDPPFDPQTHLHRIGRTARVGRAGHAIIFLLPGPEESYIPILQSSSPSALNSILYADTLKKGFGSAGIGAGKDWEEKTTEWQLDVERWALENSEMLEKARRAYQSHIRAYATHIATEREIFDLKKLHLGHLAKAFALRDRPANINVPGMRANTETVKGKFKDKRSVTGDKDASPKVDGEGVEKRELTEAAKRMRKKMNAMKGAGADEFNIA